MNLVQCAELGLQPWAPPMKGCRARTQSVDQIVVHTTGGVGDAKQIHRTLSNRGLSIHYIVANGQIVQCADPESTVTYHAGVANGRSIGIEIRNPLTGINRGWADYTEALHGRRMKLKECHAEDLFQTALLLRALTDEFCIPHNFLDTPGVFEGAEDFRGIIGHYHLTKKKLDPAPRNMYILKNMLWELSR